eukprot:CAMPEP_0117559456 /NCGR_PEP_ID=MMETSP0784-20121206/53373_1 /TAXON_ID=39447 /ORGANISM="" /LENGTH=76 /DNA_ID=CAMNT_0005356841 /DNA_START=274 /DNA_END=502 /DNA_ORIENTATION=-
MASELAESPFAVGDTAQHFENIATAFELVESPFAIDDTAQRFENATERATLKQSPQFGAGETAPARLKIDAPIITN